MLKERFMLRTMGLVVIVLVACFSLPAQETPKVEIYGGYAGARIHDSGIIDQHIFNHGWNAQVNFNFDQHLGIVGDFGGYYGTHTGPSFTPLTCLPCPGTIPGADISSQFHTFLFGPQVAARLNAFTPFAHVLFGGVHAHEDSSGGPFPPFTAGQSGFAFALGGGLDTNISPRIAWRVQGDYLNWKLFNVREDNLRISTGVVFRFGN